MSKTVTLIACLMLGLILHGYAILDKKKDNSLLAEPPEKIPASTDSLSISLSADFYTRHIWRGTLTCDSWNIQPTINLSKSNFQIGAWGAYTINNSYSELDLYVSYTWRNFSISVLDYFCPDETLKFNRLFDFKQQTTQHTIDAIASYDGTGKFPVRFMVSSLLYGDDLSPANNTNFYSTYIEAGYEWQPNKNQHFDVHIGLTPSKGYYAESFNVVSCGVAMNQTFQVTEQFSLPIIGKLIVNPYTENIFFVFGISISNL
ncbi:MAG: hypothetical protein ACLFNU_01100 [Bacteroidales bacterium]